MGWAGTVAGTPRPEGHMGRRRGPRRETRCLSGGEEGSPLRGFACRGGHAPLMQAGPRDAGVWGCGPHKKSRTPRPLWQGLGGPGTETPSSCAPRPALRQGPRVPSPAPGSAPAARPLAHTEPKGQPGGRAAQGTAGPAADRWFPWTAGLGSRFQSPHRHIWGTWGPGTSLFRKQGPIASEPLAEQPAGRAARWTPLRDGRSMDPKSEAGRAGGLQGSGAVLGARPPPLCTPRPGVGEGCPQETPTRTPRPPGVHAEPQHRPLS